MRVAVVSLLLILPASLAKDAWVYLYPPNSNEHHTPQALNPLEVNVLLGDHLGFPIYESVGDISFDRMAGLMKRSHAGRPPKIGEGEQTSVLMVIHSDYPEDFIPPGLQPTFTIPDSPSPDTFTDLIHAYTERAYQIFHRVFSSVTDKITKTKAFKSLLDIFDLAAEGSQLFVEELGAIVGYVESESSSEEITTGQKFAAFEMKGLAQLEKHQGRQSDEYILAAKSVQGVLSDPFLQTQNVAVIVVPQTSSAQSSFHHARRAVTGSVPDLPTRNKAVHSVSTCFASNSTCAEGTNDCSGHGSCSAITRAGKTCWTCTCSVTKNSKGRKQWWAGQACERQDLSSPFTLLAGTTIFLILLVGFSVSILSAVGDEELPSTLTASASHHGSKRD